MERVGLERTDDHAAAAASAFGAQIRGRDFRFEVDPEQDDDDMFHALGGVARKAES